LSGRCDEQPERGKGAKRWKTLERGGARFRQHAPTNQAIRNSVVGQFESVLFSESSNYLPRVTPAMVTGVTARVWEIADVIALIDSKIAETA
jgi:hypothetical protein